MNDKDRCMYVVLDSLFAIKGSQAEPFLFHLGTREKYVLDDEQYDLVRSCDGTKTLAEIKSRYDVESQDVASEFFENLDDIGAIVLSKHPAPRRFLDLARDPQLQAIHFELTSLCNMRCLHCYQESYLRQPTDLSFTEIERLSTEMRELQVEKIGVSGGEPFQRPDLFDIIALMEAKEISISSILTNGLKLDESILTKLKRFRSRFSLFISLDGIHSRAMKLRGYIPEQFDWAFNKLVRNIRLAVSSGIPVMINTVVTSDNISDLTRMYDWLRSMGVTGWRIALPKFAGAYVRHSTEFALHRAEVYQQYLAVITRHLDIDEPERSTFHLQIEHFFRLEVFENLEILPPDAFVCDYEGKRQSLCIKPNGDVTPCPLYLGLVIGNIRSRSLTDIWYSDAMRKVKDIRICDVSGCRDCSLSRLCATGCRANAIFIHGSIDDQDDDACEAAKFFIEQVAPVLKRKGIRTPTLINDLTA